MTYENFDRLPDQNLRLKDSGSAVTSDALATVGGSTAIIDLGAAFFEGDLVIDVSAIDVAGSDEVYRFTLIGSNSATFASGCVPLANKTIGAFERMAGAGPIGGLDTDLGTGRYVVPFHNKNGATEYRYVQLLMDGDATAATFSITYTAFVAKRQ